MADQETHEEQPDVPVTAEDAVEDDPGFEADGAAADLDEERSFCGPRVRNGGWPPKDRSGAIIPHRMNAIMLLRACPWLMPAFKTRVPDEFWSRDVSDEPGEPTAIISCQCGAEPKVPLAKTGECDCGRFFLFLGTEVRCFRPEEYAQEQAKS